jgi:beta-glucosidase
MLFTIPVTNTGSKDGTETLQVYVRKVDDPNAPLKTLRAFQRVTLKAGETRQVTLALSPESFTFYDDETNTMRVTRGRYEVLYGTSSADKDLQRLDITI